MGDLNEENRDEPTLPETIPVKTRTRWVAVFMAWCVPGLVHVLAGKYKTGIAWYLGLMAILCIGLLALALPGRFFVFPAGLLAVVFIVLYIVMLVSSYRSVRRIGWIGWVVFFPFVFGFNGYLLPLLIHVSFKRYCMETYVMSSGSMAPTLRGPSENPPEKPDRIVVNKMIYRFREPRRGEIVVYWKEPREERIAYGFRVVGIPGDTVDIKAPDILIDGKRLTDPPIFETMSKREKGFPGHMRLEDLGHGLEKRLPTTLGPDEYFVLGDNSPYSRDSRATGPVLRKDIIGKAVRIYLPLSRFGDLE